jgi:hypothetical protein
LTGGVKYLIDGKRQLIVGSKIATLYRLINQFADESISMQQIDVNLIHSKGAPTMKRLMATSIVLLAGISGEAMAACASPATQVTGAALTNLISGNTVCAVQGSDKWQEQHRAGAQLWDYKKGPSDPVDPTKQVGTWSIAGDTVTYAYTGGPSYTYSVYDDGGTYSFCTAPGGSIVVSGATFTSSPSCP